MQSMNKALYVRRHSLCSLVTANSRYFMVLFENLNLENLGMLSIIAQYYSFIKIKTVEKKEFNNNLESFFQLNLPTSDFKMKSSAICLLVSSNPRYEGYYLNISLRQNFLKGNFKCFSLGSLVDLTFPIVFLGSETTNFKFLTEGNCTRCQDFKLSENPLLIMNNKMIARNDSFNSAIDMVKVLGYSGLLSRVWNGFNMINSSLSEAGNKSLGTFKSCISEDFFTFDFLYLLNLSLNNFLNVKVLVEARLLKITKNSKTLLEEKNVVSYSKRNDPFVLNQSSIGNKNVTCISRNSMNILNRMFYETEGTFINTEGFVKRSGRLIHKKGNKNSWLILRGVLKKSRKQFKIVEMSRKIFFNSKKFSEFKNFLFFQFYATQTLTNLNNYLSMKTQPFYIDKAVNFFRLETKKNFKSKLGYWLDDFYIGGLDEYSSHSILLTASSRILRSETSNFL